MHRVIGIRGDGTFGYLHDGCFVPDEEPVKAYADTFRGNYQGMMGGICTIRPDNIFQGNRKNPGGAEMIFRCRRGTEQEFRENEVVNKILPGETVLLLDTKEIGFCFEPGYVELVKCSEEVSPELAEKLTESILRFLERQV